MSLIGKIHEERDEGTRTMEQGKNRMALILSPSQGPQGSAGPPGYPGPRGVKVRDTWCLRVGMGHWHWVWGTSFMGNVCMSGERYQLARRGVVGVGFQSE